MYKKFEERIEEVPGSPLSAEDIRILQVNVGYRCNMICKHCHVGAGPNRTKRMVRGTIDRILAVLKDHEIEALDVTCGAPEMNPHFSYLVTDG